MANLLNKTLLKFKLEEETWRQFFLHPGREESCRMNADWFGDTNSRGKGASLVANIFWKMLAKL